MTVAYAPDSTASDSAPVVELPAFPPLDLLLSLIREEQVDICIPSRVSASSSSCAFARSGSTKRPISRDGGAADPHQGADAVPPLSSGKIRAELVRRLLEYQQMREVDVLERRGRTPKSICARVSPQAPAAPQAPLALSLSELLSAVDRVLRAARRPNVHEVIQRALDIPGAISIIRSVLALRARILWTEIVERTAEPWQILSTLLGLLELAKVGELRVSQAKPFADVEITRDAASEAA
jgi:segregation and condensation protein A